MRRIGEILSESLFESPQNGLIHVKNERSSL